MFASGLFLSIAYFLNAGAFIRPFRVCLVGWSRRVRSDGALSPAPHGLKGDARPGRVQAQHDGQAVRPGREQRDRQTRAVARLSQRRVNGPPRTARARPSAQARYPPSQRSSHSSSHASPPSASASHSRLGQVQGCHGIPRPVRSARRRAAPRPRPTCAPRTPLPAREAVPRPHRTVRRSAQPARVPGPACRALSSTRRWPRTRPSPHPQLLGGRAGRHGALPHLVAHQITGTRRIRFTRNMASPLNGNLKKVIITGKGTIGLVFGVSAASSSPCSSRLSSSGPVRSMNANASSSARPRPRPSRQGGPSDS